MTVHHVGSIVPYSVKFFVFHYQTSLLLTAFSSFSLGLFIFVKNARSAVNRTFALFMLSVAGWSSMQAFIGTWPDATKWLMIARLEHIAHLFIPSLFLHFVHAATARHQPRRLIISYTISFIFLCFVPSKLFFAGIVPGDYAKFVLVRGPLYSPYVCWFIGTLIEACMKLWLAVLRSRNQLAEHAKLKYIFWGSLIGYTSAFPNFLYMYSIDAFPIIPFSTYLTPIYPALITYAIVRHQALDIRVVIRKSLVYSVLVAVLTSIYFSFVLLAEKLLQGVIGYRSLVGSLLAGFAIAMGFNPLKEVIQRLIDQIFFRGDRLTLAKENDQLRQELVRFEKLRAVSTLAAGMAHEIKNPLTSIKTFAEYLPERYDDPIFREKFAKIIGQEVDKMNALVQRLLEFAKPTKPELESVKISQTVKDTLDFIQGSLLQRKVQVKTSFADDDTITADGRQLRQVFLNVLLNSIDAMEEPGEISVSTQRHNGSLRIAVKDTGKGIAPKDLQHIFDPFYTTKTNGTGLGLSVVHSIIRQHGGQVNIRSRVGQGTTVQIDLPVNGGKHEA